MPFEFYMEIFGYIGTALVIISMLMTSVVKLRVINICGSTISMIYAIFGGAWPIVLLNASLVAINIFQLLRMRFSKYRYSFVKTDMNDKNLAYFRFLYSDDIIKHFPDYNFRNDEESEAHLVYCGSEIVAILIGKRSNDEIQVEIDYVTPKFRDFPVSKQLYKRLKSSGIFKLSVPYANEYLLRHGYSGTERLTMIIE